MLYEAIFAFLKSADLIGNVLSTITILGPVRELALLILKATIDETAGKTIKSFLATYADEAVQRLSSIVTSERNGDVFAKFWSDTITAALSRPVGSFVLSKASVHELLVVLEEQHPTLIKNLVAQVLARIETGEVSFKEVRVRKNGF